MLPDERQKQKQRYTRKRWCKASNSPARDQL